MNSTAGDSDDGAPHGGWYRIRVHGHLAPRWAVRFEAMTLTTHDDGTTLIQGPVVDQAALHGLLQHVRDTGLPLVSITQTDQPIDPTHQPHRTRGTSRRRRP